MTIAASKPNFGAADLALVAVPYEKTEASAQTAGCPIPIFSLVDLESRAGDTKLGFRFEVHGKKISFGVNMQRDSIRNMQDDRKMIPFRSANQKVVEIMQRTIKGIAFGFVLLLFPVSAIGFQPNQQVVQEQQTSLGKLLIKLRKSLDLNDEEIATLNALLKEDVVAAALEVEEKRKVLRVRSSLQGVMRGLETAMLTKAAQIVPEAKASRLTKFDASQRALWKLDDEHAQTAVLIFLDRHLCLSEHQLATLRKTLVENWEPFWNDHVPNLMGFNGYVSALPVLDLFDQELIAETLSENQLAVLADISRFVPGTELLGLEAENHASQWDPEEFRGLCLQLYELKIEEYTGMVDLSPASEKLLRIGGKAAIGKVVASRQKAMDALAEDFNAFNLPMVQASLNMAMLPQCMVQREFVKASKKALSDEKYARVKNRELLRTKTEARYFIYHMWFQKIAPVVGMSFTHDEMVGLLQILDDALESDRENQYQNVSAKWVSTPDEEFKSILSKDNWKRFKANLEANRRAILGNRK